jgi:hypothetical protein
MYWHELNGFKHLQQLWHFQVFGVTKDPFIIYSSNLFAILSLRWVSLRMLWRFVVISASPNVAGFPDGL